MSVNLITYIHGWADCEPDVAVYGARVTYLRGTQIRGRRVIVNKDGSYTRYSTEYPFFADSIETMILHSAYSRINNRWRNAQA